MQNIVVDFVYPFALHNRATFCVALRHNICEIGCFAVALVYFRGN